LQFDISRRRGEIRDGCMQDRTTDVALAGVGQELVTPRRLGEAGRQRCEVRWRRAAGAWRSPWTSSKKMKPRIPFLLHGDVPFARVTRSRMGSPLRRDALRARWIDQHRDFIGRQVPIVRLLQNRYLPL
jgi:hypothetical protein